MPDILSKYLLKLDSLYEILNQDFTVSLELVQNSLVAS